MTDLSLPPLEFREPALSRGIASSASPAKPKARAIGFCWPTPPFAAYPPAIEQTRPEPCVIEGLNGKIIEGRLTLFMPEDQLVSVQVPPARTTMTLHFGQFRSLALTEPVAPHAPAAGDPHADVLDLRPRNSWRLQWKGGACAEGETIGHVQTDAGLFLFLPLDDNGIVSRLFVPAAGLASHEIGPRVGTVLVERHAATAEQVAEAIQLQRELRTRKLGEILLGQRVVTAEQLVQALDKQARMPMMRLGEALIALGLVTERQLDAALEQQKSDRGVPIGELLVRLGCVTRDDVQAALTHKMGYPFVEVAAFAAETDALRRLPYSVARRLEALPLVLRDSTLVVALVDPSRRAAIDEMEFASQCKVVPVLAAPGEIDTALRAAYARVGVADAEFAVSTIDAGGFDLDGADAGKLLESLEREGAQRTGGDDEPQVEQSDNSLVRLIHTMIVEAWTQGVSDIHVESYPGRDKLKIRFRKDGTLKPYLELPHTYRNAVIGRLKIMCDLDISERRKPQDGKINFGKFSPAHRFELRVATVPTHSGLEDVVMRLLTSAKPVPLPKLGLSARHLGQVQSAMERPYGLVLCVGPTGSGKTTTLHSALAHINVPERKIWTAEDPIEITQPGLRQVQVNPKIDWSFAKALRAFLRADPDVIMVGEIRDAETARTAIEASLTGHLVLSTLHTNSAPETVTRLLDMGMDPFNFADSLLLVAAQRLVRKLCGECRSARPMTDEEERELLDDHLFALAGADTAQGRAPADQDAARETLRANWLGRFGQGGRLQHYAARGCKACGDTGFRGRHGIHELMPVSRELRRLIQTGARAEALQAAALTEGMLTLRQDGIEKVLQGATTIDEVRATSNV